jgi:hypothetical protein
MNRPTDEDPPPNSTDLDAWRQAVTDGRYKQYRLEAVVAAIQDLGSAGRTGLRANCRAKARNPALTTSASTWRTF